MKTVPPVFIFLQCIVLTSYIVEDFLKNQPKMKCSTESLTTTAFNGFDINKLS
jgi:hypothetical protein